MNTVTITAIYTLIGQSHYYNLPLLQHWLVSLQLLDVYLIRYFTLKNWITFDQTNAKIGCKRFFTFISIINVPYEGPKCIFLLKCTALYVVTLISLLFKFPFLWCWYKFLHNIYRAPIISLHEKKIFTQNAFIISFPMHIWKQ